LLFDILFLNKIKVKVVNRLVIVKINVIVVLIKKS